jgi:membrane protein DedA with SNARE-associated domain
VTRLGALLQLFLHFGHAPVVLGVMAERGGIPLPGEERTVLVVGFFASQWHLHPGVVILLATAAGMVGDNGGYLLSEKVARPPSPAAAGSSYSPRPLCRGADEWPSLR